MYIIKYIIYQFDVKSFFQKAVKWIFKFMILLLKYFSAIQLSKNF